MIFPLLLFIAVIIANLMPTLWVLFCVVAVLKAALYSFNEPVKELLYQPTSIAIKFKAKAWIDVFGSRLAKAGGSFISTHARGSVQRLQLVSELPSFAISIILIIVAWQAGTQFQYLVREGVIVGDSPRDHEDEFGDYALKIKEYQHRGNKYSELVKRRGLKPGDVGYDGYDLGLFEGVFDDDAEDIFRSTEHFKLHSSANKKNSFKDIKLARDVRSTTKASIRKIVIRPTASGSISFENNNMIDERNSSVVDGGDPTVIVYCNDGINDNPGSHVRSARSESANF